MPSLTNWNFTEIVPAFPFTVFPNVAIWNVTNGLNRDYQLEVSWPLEWASREVNESALTLYVLDGNALGMTATEAIRRRRAVEFIQPDTIVVSIGYPVTDSVYGPQRATDLQPPTDDGSIPAAPGVPSGANDFIDFIDHVLRPFVHTTIFPRVTFGRDGLYGHSFGGLFVVYALITRPDLFDSFFSTSPALFWNNGSILNDLGQLETKTGNFSKPAFAIGYGSLEQYPIKRRTENETFFEFRKSFIQAFRMTDNCNELYNRLRNSTKLRDITIKEYAGQDHFGVAGSALFDGYEAFIDW